MMKTLSILACCSCFLGCTEKASHAKQESLPGQSDPKSQFDIRKTDLEHIEQLNGVILVDTIIRPNERIDVPKGSEFRRIGVCVDKQSDFLRCKGFVSLTGTDGSRQAS